MILKYVALGLVSGISFSLISWMIWIIFNGLFSNTRFYNRFSNLNFIEDRMMNKYLGISQFKWIVKHTFLKIFNQKIKINNRSTNLEEIRKEMTLAEVSHLVGFLFVILLSIYYCVKVSIVYGMTMMIPNVFLNLYPSLLQQENKRRIDKLIKRRLFAS
jgi:hypothetical protein